MNKQNTYSDEHLSAYIDGELDGDERARLLFDEQENAELAQRINEMRMLKEKVKLAFPPVNNSSTNKNTFNTTEFASRYRALAAGLLLFTAIAATFIYNMNINNDLILAKQLIKNTRPIAANTINNAIGTNKHVVIHLSQYRAQDFSETINHLEALLLQHSNDEIFNVEIVANGQGLKALDVETSSHAERISQLAKQFNSLEVVACARSLARLAEEGDPVQLVKSIMTIPSAPQQVAKRTGDNWLYLKL